MCNCPISHYMTLSNTTGINECLLIDCKPGYTNKGSGCEDEDECFTLTDPCSGGQCRNTLGSFECDCNNGYEKDDFTGQCTNIDECKTGKHRQGYQRMLAHFTIHLSKSSQGSADYDISWIRCFGKCIGDTDGSYICDPCPAGYTDPYDTAVDKTGLIKGTFCDDSDECADGKHKCHLQARDPLTMSLSVYSDDIVHRSLIVATCTNAFPDYTCDCDEGFSGDGFDCIADICPDGFQSSGSDCVNIDQCAKGKYDATTNPDGHDCDDKGRIPLMFKIRVLIARPWNPE